MDELQPYEVEVLLQFICKIGFQKLCLSNKQRHAKINFNYINFVPLCLLTLKCNWHSFVYFIVVAVLQVNLEKKQLHVADSANKTPVEICDCNFKKNVDVFLPVF